MRRTIYLFSFISLAIAISLGALAAHSLKPSLKPGQLESFKTGVFYQITHALGLLASLNFFRQVISRKAKWALQLLKIGPVLFSGSIYILATGDLTGMAQFSEIIGPITPIGGIMMIAGWILLAMTVFKTRFSDE